MRDCAEAVAPSKTVRVFFCLANQISHADHQILVPGGSRRAWHHVALTPLAALDELVRVDVWVVVDPGAEVLRRARIAVRLARVAG